MSTETNSMQPNPYLFEIENRRKRKPRLAHELGAGVKCKKCGDKCPGFELHYWRKICMNCRCGKDDHEVDDDDNEDFGHIVIGRLFDRPARTEKEELEYCYGNSLDIVNEETGQAENVKFDWVPPNTEKSLASRYMELLPPEKRPVAGSEAAKVRRRQLEQQLPLYDVDAGTRCETLHPEELQNFQAYLERIRSQVAGQGTVQEIIGGLGPMTTQPLHSQSRLGMKTGQPFATNIDTNGNIGHYSYTLPDDNATSYGVQNQGNTQNNDVCVPESQTPQMNDYPQHGKSRLRQQFLEGMVGEPGNILRSKTTTGTTSSTPYGGYVSGGTALGTGHDKAVENLSTGLSDMKVQAMLSDSAQDEIKQIEQARIFPKADYNLPTPKKITDEAESVGDTRYKIPTQEKLLHPAEIFDEKEYSFPTQKNVSNQFGSSDERAYKSPSKEKVSYLSGGYDEGQCNVATQGKVKPPVAPKPYHSIRADHHNLQISPDLHEQPEYLSSIIPGYQPPEYHSQESDKTGLSSNQPLIQPLIKNSQLKQPGYVKEQTIHQTPQTDEIHQQLPQYHMHQPSHHDYQSGSSNYYPQSDQLKKIRDQLHDQVNEQDFPPPIPELLGYPSDTGNENADTSRNTNSFENNGAKIGSRPYEDGIKFPMQQMLAKERNISHTEATQAPYGAQIDTLAGGMAMAHGSDVTILFPKESQALGTQTPKGIKSKHSCQGCNQSMNVGDVAIFCERAGSEKCWHPACFCCFTCKELLADLIYFYKDDKVYCGRHFTDAEAIPRCKSCDELIFSNSWTRADGFDWHINHFCCNMCDTPMAGQRYVPDKNGYPYCLPCYMYYVAKTCESCEEKISPEVNRCGHRGYFYHATPQCFKCYMCQESLLGKRFKMSKNWVFCSNECIQKAATDLANNPSPKIKEEM